jgi:SCP-like extracellular protein.
VFSQGKAQFHGSVTGLPTAEQPASPVVGIVANPGGGGYWLVTSAGDIYSFGKAAFHGSTGAIVLNKPIVGMASTPHGNGYWLVAADGGVFAFGSAKFYGSMGATPLNKPIVGMASTPNGQGYWLVAADGGIFSFGDAGFHGSTGAITLAKPIVGMASTPHGNGYWLAASDGGVFSFGSAKFYGSGPQIPTTGPTTGIATTPSGYELIQADGNIHVFSPGTSTTPQPTRTTTTTTTTQPTKTSTTTTTTTTAQPPHAFAPSENPSPMPPAIGTTADPFVGNPPFNYPLSPAATTYCLSAQDSVPACNKAMLALIDDALAGEGYGPLPLPSNFASLAIDQQLLAITNAERTVRGLPALTGPVPSLDAAAQVGASAGTDPVGPSDTSWGSIWAGGWLTPLAADYGWMYADGPGAYNVDCLTADSPGCWGHRNNILHPGSGSAGVAVSNSNGVLNFAELFTYNS